MGIGYTPMPIELLRIEKPFHLQSERIAATGDGDEEIDLSSYIGFINKIQVNGNADYDGGPTTVINIYYKQDNTERHIYGPLNISTVDVSIGLSLSMKALLGQDLRVGGSNPKIITRISSINTRVVTDIWGYEYSEA